jgi:hypothetical protein
MSDVFYLRPVNPPITPDDAQGMSEYARDCFSLHSVDWKHSFLATDGARMLCWYKAPDAESARLALRQLGSDMNAVWTGKVAGEGPDSPPLSAANIVAEIQSDEPLADARLASCTVALEQQAVTLVRSFLSNRGTQCVWVLEATREDTVRAALDSVALSAERVWPCVSVTPQMLGR